MIVSAMLIVAALAPADTWTLMEELRTTRTFSNGHFNFETVWTDLVQPATREGSFRFNGEDVVFTEFDPEQDIGRVYRPRAGMRRARVGPYQVLNSGDAMQSMVSTSGYDFDTPIPDWRQIGLYPEMSAIETGDHRFLRSLVSVGTHPEIVRDLDEGLIRTAVNTDDARLVIWQDPQRGRSVVRSQLWTGDILARECRVELKQVGPDWFPEQVEYYQDHNDRLELACRVRLTDIRIEPDDPQPLTMPDAGVVIGTNVALVNSLADLEAHGSVGRQPHGWDGHAIVSGKEIHSRLLHGALQKDEAFERDATAFRLAVESGELHQFLMRQYDQAANPSAWHQYTLDFARQHKFDQVQQQQARLICRDSEAKARAIVRRFAEGEPDLGPLLAAVLESERQRMPHEKRSQLEEALKRRARLHDQVRGVFERDLQPRLERLVTRTQRALEQGDG